MTADRKKWIGLALALLPLLLAAGLYLLLPYFPGFTETVVTGGVFRALSVPFGWLISWLPFSLTEVLVVLGIPTALVWLVVGIVRAGRRKRWFPLIKTVCWILSVGLLLYMLLHGVNFYRRPVAEIMDLTVTAHSTDDLAALAMQMAANAEKERQALSENADGTVAVAVKLTDAGEGFAVLDDHYPFLWGATNRVKRVLLSHYWSYTGITGMYFPLLAEANVNTDQPAWCIPFTACHELAHTRGFAREDECNFLGYLAAISHPDAAYRYSGYYMGYIYCNNALYALDPDKAATVSATVSEGMRRDLIAQSAYWQQFEGPVQDVSDAVNDGFITSQGVPDGVYSYGRCVDLLLAWETRGKN